MRFRESLTPSTTVRRGLTLLTVVAGLSISLMAGVPTPGNLLVSRSVYSGTASTVTVGQALPGGGTAVANGSYPGVWANEGPDGSFGVTSPIFIDEMTPSGTVVDTINVPTAQMVTSFSSKSELALNLSTDGTAVTFMGYVAPVNALDVSNSNTPNHVDPTNPVPTSWQRAIGQLNSDGSIIVTPVNSYSGNNGRAAVLSDGLYYLAGNAGNGSTPPPPPTLIVANTGVQLATPFGSAETTVVGIPRLPAPIPPATVGVCPANKGCESGFSVVDVGAPADKSGKDDNFRSTTIFNNTLYVTKGSGSNGVNTVYQVGTAGTLPTLSTASTTPITILPGLWTGLASGASPRFPFATWFANATTLYVADEGDGTMANAATDKQSGVEKWILVGGTWQLAYTLQNGLNLGVAYTVPTPSGSTPVPSPATDGLRSLTGRVNADKTVTLYGVTSTVSSSKDQGADPNKLVTITDTIAATTPAEVTGEAFTTLRSAGYGEVLRGVAFAGPYVVIKSLVPTPATIWPPDKRSVPVSVAVNVSDIVDPSPSCKLVSINSNEGTSDDWQITGALTATLKADRTGKGGNRVYVLTVQCTDIYGHVATQTTDVTVPHDQGGGH